MVSVKRKSNYKLIGGSKASLGSMMNPKFIKSFKHPRLKLNHTYVIIYILSYNVKFISVNTIAVALQLYIVLFVKFIEV